ncbi:hypothetical protein E1K68_19890 [Pseudomonas sp. B2021]|nr:hypothetical protein [Pseudomonas sp. B2021]
MAAAHGFKPVFGHTEPGRGAEWWGKSALLTFALFESEPPSGRNPKWPLPQEWICTRYMCRLSGRLREQARSHSWMVGCQVDRCRLAGHHRRQASSHS